MALYNLSTFLIQRIIETARRRSYLLDAAAVCSIASADLHRRAIKVPERAIRQNKVASI